MDERKMPFREQKDASRKRASDECEKDSDMLGQELAAINLNGEHCAEFATKSTNIFKKRKVDSDEHLEVDEGKSLCESTLQASSKIDDDEYMKAIDHDSDDKKIKKTALNYFKKRVTNPKKTFKNIKGKILKIFKSDSSRLSETEEEDTSEMDTSSETSEEKISQTKLGGFKNLKSRVTNIVKRKKKDGTLPRLETMPQTSPKSTDITLPSSSTQYSPTSITQCHADQRTQTSEVRSSKDFLGHFRTFMQSGMNSSDRINTDNINKDMNPSPEYRIHSLEYPTTTESTDLMHLKDFVKARSTIRNLNDIETEVMEYSLIKNARKGINKVSAYQVNSSNMINTIYIPRQRTVYDEHTEHILKWISALAKDKEMMMKFTIMEGRFEEDWEEKRTFVEKADGLQDEIDALFDCIDDFEKMYNIIKKPSKCLTKPPKEINKENISTLFRQLYKPSSSEYKIGNLLKMIDPEELMLAYGEYIKSKEDHDSLADAVKADTIRDVNKFYSALAECVMEKNFKISLSDNRSLRYYQTSINILETAVDESLTSLQTLISLADFLPSPLYTHMCESHSKTKRMVSFLEEKRSNVFSKRLDRNKAFFEQFCQRNFKNY